MLEKFTTSEIQDELSKREGVNKIIVEPYQKIMVGGNEITGPCIIMMIVD